ncbi:DinB family protein [Bacillus thuringiensis]|uniref:DinB family protein n=3 Tax=Bacillus TaxID=1386 RepID=A0ABD6SJB5_BACTU|nr:MULTISPECIES: DinB family protein [Bacillus]MBJ8127379.1 DinB family protein [Bacillus cereus]PDY98440.1 DinB family protein [Bacillus thuringiensis]PEF29422.1 DinB family protein [Bacillus thuringiensis]PES78951.1 DinB family protein [Bacillus thuringiensis]PET86441.1 DinB family protein [Bacillus thuringiensis]
MSIISKILLEQFEMTRNCFIQVVDSVPKELLHIQPSCFKNTIQWQVGHVLTITEQYIFEFPEKSMHIPKNYIEFFGEGTSPLNWPKNAPKINELEKALKNQLNRICKLSFEKFEATLKEPVLGYTTFYELASMLLLHEAYHLGQIYSMHKIIESENQASSTKLKKKNT